MKILVIILLLGVAFSLPTGAAAFFFVECRIQNYGLPNWVKLSERCWLFHSREKILYSCYSRSIWRSRFPMDLLNKPGTVIGKIKWDLKNLILTDIQFPQTTIEVLPGNGMKITMYSQKIRSTFSLNAGAHFNCEWHYRKVHWPHISDHGTAQIEVGQLSV